MSTDETSKELKQEIDNSGAEYKRAETDAKQDKKRPI